MSVGVMKDYKLKKAVVYYESLKRELKTKTIYRCRCDETHALKAKAMVAGTSCSESLERMDSEKFQSQVRSHGRARYVPCCSKNSITILE